VRVGVDSTTLHRNRRFIRAGFCVAPDDVLIDVNDRFDCHCVPFGAAIVPANRRGRKSAKLPMISRVPATPGAKESQSAFAYVRDTPAERKN
jgi:hypothetical protein